MRFMPMLALGFCLAAPAAHASQAARTKQGFITRAGKSGGAKAGTAKAGRRVALTEEKRGQLAVNAVERSLEGWVKPGAKVSIRPAIVPFNGDARNPITGLGPVEVFVTQDLAVNKGFFRRMWAKLNPNAKQKYLVHVGENGETQILERLSLAPQRRLGRFIAEKMPLASMLVDFTRSSRAAEGLWTLVGATGAAPLSPALSGALFMRLAQVFHQGITSQKAVRALALDQTVAWASATRKGSGQWPTLMETYRAYQGKVGEQQEGARALELGDFAEALSIRQL